MPTKSNNRGLACRRAVAIAVRAGQSGPEQVCMFTRGRVVNLVVFGNFGAGAGDPRRSGLCGLRYEYVHHRNTTERWE